MQRVKTALEMVSTVLVIAAAGALLWTTYSRAKAAEPPPLVSDVKGSIEAAQVRHVQGGTAGGLMIVEFSDFECPFCAEHATKTLPELRKQLPAVGYAVLNFPLEQIHQHALSASLVAECASQQGKGKYWEL